jgi:hypothetical protein
METPMTPAPAPEEPKKNNTLMIVGIVIIVLCCCCVAAAGAYWLWNNGDRLMQGTNLLLQIA